jgi:hypothetical protein
MVTVLCAIALHDDDLPIVASHREANSVHGVAGADLTENVLGDVGVAARRAEIVVDVVEKARGHGPGG